MADNVCRMRFVEKSLASLEKVDILNTGFYHRLPTACACPPMPPEVEVGAHGVASVLRGVSNCARLGMVLRMTALTELVAMAGRDAAAHALAPVLLVVIASVRSTAKYLAVFYDDGPRLYQVIERVFFGVLFGRHHVFVIYGDVSDRAAGGEVGVRNCRHSDNVSQCLHDEVR